MRSRPSSAAPWWRRAEAAARPATAPLASASTACRACEGVECGPGESCYVNDDGTTTACFPSGLDLDGWTECPRPDDGGGDESGEDEGEADGDEGDEGEGDDEGGEDGEDEGDEDDDGEEDDEGGEDDGEEDDEDGEDEDEDGEGEDDDEEDDDEGEDDGPNSGDDDDEGEPGAGGCAGFGAWPADLAGRLNLLTQMVDRAAAILGIEPPPVTFADNPRPNLVALYNQGRIKVNGDRLEAGDTTFDEWMDTVLHEVHHAYMMQLTREFQPEMSTHRNALQDRGINWREQARALQWGPELDALRDLTRPTGDPALADVWDWEFDSYWRNSRGGIDLAPGPGTLEDTPVPDDEFAIYLALAEERQARSFAAAAMDDYGLRCNQPGDVKESAGRSQ